MVPFGCQDEISFQSRLDHRQQIAWNNIASHRNDPLGSDAHHRQGQRVIAAEDRQVRCVEDLRALIERSGGFLDHRDVRNFRKLGDRLGLDVLGRTARDVVDTVGDADFRGDCFEVLVEASLGGLVVVGSDLQGCVCTFLGCPAGQTKGFCRAVAAGSRHDFASATGRLDHFADDALVLIVGERWRLPCSPYGYQESHAGTDLEIDLFLEPFNVELALAKWGYYRNSNACKIASLARTHELMCL